MNAPADFPTMQYRGITLRADPAREPCFRIVHQHYEVYRPTLEHPSDPTGREGLHSLYNSEVLSLEIAAQGIADYPDAPWELRLELARHCWDEARHARLLSDRLAELGCAKGDYPIINHEYNVVCRFPSLVARLAVQNRTFEAGSIDSFHVSREYYASRGDHRTVEVLEAIVTDEVGHARFGNEWVHRLTRSDPGNAMRVARAINELKHIAAVLATQPGEVVIDGHDLASMRHEIDIHGDDRQDSGFTASEIESLVARDQRRNDGAPAPPRAP